MFRNRCITIFILLTMFVFVKYNLYTSYLFIKSIILILYKLFINTLSLTIPNQVLRSTIFAYSMHSTIVRSLNERTIGDLILRNLA